jgi:hypothetical protein
MDVSEGLCSLTNSGGLRPQVLGNDHATDAVPKARLTDVSTRELGRSSE